MEYKQADFCKTYGLEPSTVSKAIKRGALQKNTAGLMDDENTLNKVFLAKRRLRGTNEALADDGKNAERIIKQIDFSALNDDEIAKNAGLPRMLLGMTIRELVIKFRGLDGLEGYIKMLRDLAAADEKDQKTQERRLQLVEKDFIIARVIQFLDVLMKQLLEWPDGAVDGIIAIVQSEGSAARRDITRLMEKGMTEIIKDSKSQVIKEINSLRTKYQDDDIGEKIREAVEEAVGA
jgi:DNA-binding transcriptional ArsR family regulator